MFLSRNYSGEVNVKDFGALGDNKTDDTQAIQNAIDNFPNGGKIFIPDGNYMINATVGLKPKSRQTISLARNAKIKVIPSNSGSYRIFDTVYVSDVIIEGGYLEGDKDNHIGKAGASGHGIVIGSQANNTIIRNMRISKFWGDGIYIGGAYPSTNSKIYNVICDNNRRQGMSITYADGVVVRDSTFSNTSGALPEAGIDIEPNAGNIVNNVVLDNVTCIGNRSGIEVFGASAKPKNVRIINSTMNNNRDYGVSLAFTSDVSVDGCEMSGNKNGLLMSRDNNNVQFRSSQFIESKNAGANLSTSLQRIEGGIGTKNIQFDSCVFKNNSKDAPNQFDGCVIDTDGRNVMDRITFNQCDFVDNQLKPTQRYGLMVASKPQISNVVLGFNNFFSGNVTADKNINPSNTSEIMLQPATQ